MESANGFERLETCRAHRYHWTFRAGNSIYVQDRHGLLLLDRDSLRPLPGGERFANERIYCVSLHNDRLVVGVQEGMFLHEGGTFKPYPTEADALLRKHNLTRAPCRRADWW
jgi:hypothetical protein